MSYPCSKCQSCGIYMLPDPGGGCRCANCEPRVLGDRIRTTQGEPCCGQIDEFDFSQPFPEELR